LSPTPVATLPVLAASLFLFQNALAAEIIELEPALQVTASRTHEPINRSMATISVINAEDIRRSLAEDMAGLLRLEAGIDVVRTGGAGAQTSVFMRGSNSNHALVLIDGVRVASTNTGAYAWEQLPLNLVERVEIVRGPRASIYGSDAIGGVIQIFTRSDPHPVARATVGSFGTAELAAGFGFASGSNQVSINAAYRDVDGFSAQNQDGFSYHPDDDGFQTANLGINGSNTNSNGQWQYSLLASETETAFDQGESEGANRLASLSWQGRINDEWDSHLQAGWSSDELENDFDFFKTVFESSRYDFRWRSQRKLVNNGWLALGVDHYRESGRSGTGIDENRHNTGLFAQIDKSLDGIGLQGSLRYDDNSEFGSKVTGQIAAKIELGDSGQLVGSYGSGFRAPNLNEQFSPGFGGYFAGNPELNPESSDSYELAYRHRASTSSNWSMSAYHTDISDLISFSGEQFAAVNINQAQLRGLEFEWHRQSHDWRMNANLTLQDTEDLTSGASLLRRPDKKGSLCLDHFLSGGGWLGVDWYLSGEQLDFGGVKLPGYGLVNLRGGLAIGRDWTAELRIENIADRNYVPAFGFNSGGRATYFSLSWQP
jgi:vitamin B12 transporter